MNFIEKIQNRLENGEYNEVNLHDPEWDNQFDEEGNYIGPEDNE